MEKYFSLLRIQEKLTSLMRFASCSGIVLETGGRVYATPEEMATKAADLTKSDPHRIKVLPFRNGRLVFLDPSEPMGERTLRFLAEEMDREIELNTVFDVLSEASLTISSKLELNPLLHKVMSLSEEIFNAEVGAVILLDPERGELYWEVSKGEKSEMFEKKMTLPLGTGIAGAVARDGESMLVKDVSQEPKWDSSYDRKTGFRTRSLMCAPVTFRGNTLGVLEVINKRDGDFTPKDLRMLEILAAQTGAAIENARIYKKLKEAYDELSVLNKARERVINHLSHELRTPLAIIKGVLVNISRKLESGDTESLEKSIQRGYRNIDRLLDLQAKIDDILNQRPVKEKDAIVNLVESAFDLIAEMGEEEHGRTSKRLLHAVSERLESLFRLERVEIEEVPIDEFLSILCDEAASAMSPRELEITRRFETGLILTMDKTALRKVCSGLLRNAIENTPDGGRIEVLAKKADEKICIIFRDYGVGITEQNQKAVFGGFFHTQDTDLYTSKRPYAFNAGGAGADLLRTKVFSERFGFYVDFQSSRCRFIPTDQDVCPGQISSCPFIEDASGCFSSGSSLFSLTFPAK